MKFSFYYSIVLSHREIVSFAFSFDVSWIAKERIGIIAQPVCVQLPRVASLSFVAGGAGNVGLVCTALFAQRGGTISPQDSVGDQATDFLTLKAP